MIKYKVKVVGSVSDALHSMNAIKFFDIFAFEKENKQDIQMLAIAYMTEYLSNFTVLYNLPSIAVKKVEILERILDNENK